ncbi:tyrosine-type recombinase/integrase [Nocardia asiatica]|uniref:tyrosine-type recombinase/integrase n=1 Tax=Nocardia asiatica TaxID=209252 RepID=UPI002455AD60|nr:site-specific integrase [Nocardia asiatica]
MSTTTLRALPGWMDRHPEQQRYAAALDQGFLDGAGWHQEQRVMSIPPGHPTLGYAICNVKNCDVVAVRVHGLCPHCHLRWRAVSEPMSIEEFWAVGRTGRVIGEDPCAVADCQRSALSTVKRLCRAHDWQRTRQMRVSLHDFLLSPLALPLPSFGPCRVAACPRQTHSDGPLGMCRAHGAKWAKVKKTVNPPELDAWCRGEGAVVERGQISLRGLPEPVVTELLLGLQLRCAEGVRTPLRTLRNFTHKLRAQQVSTVADLTGIAHERNMIAFWRSIMAHLRRVSSTPEKERSKDIWDATVFGHRGTINFAGIRQRWLRETAKEWAFEDLPTRRGNAVANVVQAKIKCLQMLSDSLSLQRDDQGEIPALLGRADIVAFLNRLAYLETTALEISRNRRVRICRDTARILRDVRGLGLAQAGRPAAGLADDFTFRRGDTPDELVDDDAGRALPEAVLRLLYEALPTLEERSSREARVATELMMDTGRRPDEVLQLPLDCLDQDSDGKFVLVYQDFKLNRKARRLPIIDATAEVIKVQQAAVIARFPSTDCGQLPLLPSPLRNPRGLRRIPQASFGSAHRHWTLALLPITLPSGIKITSADLVPYAYRHSFAQRHADAGVPVDVLRDLMGHRSIATTQIYYRITEKRTREAVNKVTQFQFDRHGNRVWRQAQALLDDERARLQIGQVAVPYGICTEPSNVQAGGQSCPFRFRCVGCGHFRTDASYLPDLRAYLQDLLRDRERVLATAELDQWARAEATPSETEIKLIKGLINRVENDLEDLTDEEREQINAAVKVVRATRNTVSLGMPRIAPPRPALNGETG